VVTAPGPEKLIPGGRYTVEFAVEVAVGKYTDHLPLERQVRMMAREGLEVDSQTLWDQVHALAMHLKPPTKPCGKSPFGAGAPPDETRWPLLGKKGKSPGSVGRRIVSRSSSPIRILAVDDHPLVRRGIAGLIGAQPEVTFRR
jgi:hypothetical protein